MPGHHPRKADHERSARASHLVHHHPHPAVTMSNDVTMYSTATGPQAHLPGSDKTHPISHPIEHSSTTTGDGATTSESLPTSGRIKDDEKSFPFLKLSAELRNAIYEYTFKYTIAGERWSGIAPHALTHVNRQIRSESLGMYHQYPKTVGIVISSTEHERHFQEWIETGMQLYPVLPELRISWKDPSAPATYLTLKCTRSIVSYLSHTEEEQILHAYRDYIRTCTGSRISVGKVFQPTAKFRDALDIQKSVGQRMTWRVTKNKHDWPRMEPSK